MNTPQETKAVKRVHKPKLNVVTFPFYLDAWVYCQREKINKSEIKKTGAREFTLKFWR